MAWPIDPGLGFLRTGKHDAFGADTGGRLRPHSGVDFTPYKLGAAIPVYAVEEGQVFYVGGHARDTTGPGINVRIQQPSGHWLYGHLSRADVKAGQRVSEGQQIGLTGASGGTTGVHLHVTRFITRATALANASPSHRLGRSVADWAAANALADPMEIINRAAPGGSDTTTIDLQEVPAMAIIIRTTNAHPKQPQYFFYTENGFAPIERSQTKELTMLRQVLKAIHAARNAGVTDIAVNVHQARTLRDFTNRAAGRAAFVPDILAK